jgi:hypothetical protein
LLFNREENERENELSLEKDEEKKPFR